MKQITTIESMRAQVRAWQGQGLTVALVPTMGNLHAGHLSLVDYARSQADKVVVSIFVNPTQFAPHEDFAAYPRTLQQDCQLLQAKDCAAVFCPAANLIYPETTAATTFITVPGLVDDLCGVSRPHFFFAVATVVAKLFNIIPADVAVFGEKDYQQLLLIKRMVNELNFPIRILGAPIVREIDGLAMSSRNQYLDGAARAKAPGLYQVLTQVTQALATGADDYAALTAQASLALQQLGFTPDYVAIRRAADLTVPAKGETSLRVLAAAWLGTTRLLDNLQVDS